MPGKLGRRPAQFTQRSLATASLMTATLGKLGTPPSASVNRFSAVTDWRMFCNDSIGDCVEADTAHDLLFRTTVSGSPIVATDDDVKALYTAVAGFDPSRPETDHGTVIAQMEAYLVSTGFLGHKAHSTVNLNVANLNHIRWAIELFGSCRLGINFPASAMEQFENGHPWDTVVNDGGIEGGHDIRAVNYRDSIFDVVTWGKVIPMTAAFAAKYLEEAHAELFIDWIQANGSSPGGFSLDDLISDLNALNN